MTGIWKDMEDYGGNILGCVGIWWHLGGMWRDIMASELDMEGNGGNNMGCGGKGPLRMSDCLTGG